MQDVKIIITIVNNHNFLIDFSPTIDNWPLGRASFFEAQHALNEFHEKLSQNFINLPFDKQRLKYYVWQEMQKICQVGIFLINLTEVVVGQLPPPKGGSLETG